MSPPSGPILLPPNGHVNNMERWRTVLSCWYLSPPQHVAGYALGLPRYAVSAANIAVCAIRRQTAANVWCLVAFGLGKFFLAESRGIATICEIHGRLFAKRITCHGYALMDIHKSMVVTHLTYKQAGSLSTSDTIQYILGNQLHHTEMLKGHL